MSLELLSMLGGGMAGFLMRFLAAQAEAQSAAFDRILKAQSVADDSADRAAARPGVWVRRGLAASVIFALVFAPFFLSFFKIPIRVEEIQEWWDVLGVFSGGWETLEGYVILPEVRQAMLAVVGFYLGSAQVKS